MKKRLDLYLVLFVALSVSWPEIRNARVGFRWVEFP